MKLAPAARPARRDPIGSGLVRRLPLDLYTTPYPLHDCRSGVEIVAPEERELSHAHPGEVVWGIINLHALARCLHVVAEAGVADALDESPASAADLARRTGLNADALHRVLRLLAAHGVFAVERDGYAHNDASRLLRSDHPRSMRSFARMIGLPVTWNGFTELGHALRTGKPALEWAGLVEYFAQHPDEGRVFNEAMAGKSASVIPAVIASYDFSPFAVIADIGGGRGHLLRAVLEQVQTARGVLFELPQVIADAAGSATPRLRLAAGDFFVDPLPQADAYLLMEVIHDWADEQAAQILAAVRRAAPSHARVLIVEALVSEEPGPQFGKMLDVIMLALTGGRERTVAEYGTLLGAAGLRMERVVPTPSQYSILEASVV